MERIHWDASFSVGVAKLDEQHRRLIGMINLLLDDSEADVRSETVSEILTRMTEYAREHFDTEEQLLTEHGYPDLAAHREEHVAFRKKAAVFCVETMRHRTSIPVDLLEYLRAWWTGHIRTVDMRYRSFFEERGVT